MKQFHCWDNINISHQVCVSNWDYINLTDYINAKNKIYEEQHLNCCCQKLIAFPKTMQLQGYMKLHDTSKMIKPYALYKSSNAQRFLLQATAMVG